MKQIAGWDQFVADARRDPLLVPLWDGQAVTVHYPSKRKMKRIFDDQSNLQFADATKALFGDETGRRLLDESEDHEGAPLEHMVMTILVEFDLLGPSVLERFNRDPSTDDAEGAGDPNPTNSSDSSTGTEVSLNGTSPSTSELTSSTTSGA